jgi:hypothetical protein
MLPRFRMWPAVPTGFNVPTGRHHYNFSKLCDVVFLQCECFDQPGNRRWLRGDGIPDDGKGESTEWYTSFWRFAAGYPEQRFQTKWSLSPETIIVGSGLAARSPKETNSVTKLPHGMSLFDQARCHRPRLPSLLRRVGE